MKPDPRPWALAGLTTAVVAIGIDVTILNVALPTIAADVAATTSDLQWIVNAYVLVFAGLLLPSGALADRYGRRRWLLAGLAVFGAGSLAAAWSGDAAQIIGARAVLGVGAAIIMPTTLASLAELFTGAARAKAVSVLVSGMGVGIPLGPVVGGYLIDHFWWGSIFLINLPIVAIAGLAVAAFVPESRDPAPPRPDPVGALLSTVGLVGFVYAVIEAPQRGWGAPQVVAALVASIGMLTAFVRWGLRRREPAIDLRLFGDRRFRWASINATLASFALFGLLFIAPPHLQVVLGFDALGTGLRLLPMVAGLVVGAGLATRAAARLGHRLPMVAGLLIAAAGLLLGAAGDTGTGYGQIATWYVVAGFGVGATLAPAMDAALAAMPPARSGAGIAVTMTMRQVGGALGVALLGSLLSQTYSWRLDTGDLPPAVAAAAEQSLTAATALDLAPLTTAAHAAYADAMAGVLLATAVVCVLGAAATAVLMPGPAARQGLAEPAGQHDAYYGPS
ncbi:DHA2 family efflux MFS transporter permease subunit [Dactylosporangium sp. NPDC005572]|uniref:DHA2 family efflux MFS transporter permease subunit n=1 Tax=Dactylosporangium sp. NPDC005572 TaxID=3156889 RepID=UPI0033B4D48C